MAQVHSQFAQGENDTECTVRILYILDWCLHVCSHTNLHFVVKGGETWGADRDIQIEDLKTSIRGNAERETETTRGMCCLKASLRVGCSLDSPDGTKRILVICTSSFLRILPVWNKFHWPARSVAIGHCKGNHFEADRICFSRCRVGVRKCAAAPCWLIVIEPQPSIPTVIGPVRVRLEGPQSLPFGSNKTQCTNPGRVVTRGGMKGDEPDPVVVYGEPVPT
jgi:hypothetical protein